MSISAGVAAVTSAFESLRPYRIELCLGALLLMTLANLRGTKESGKLFAPPVYTYVVSLAFLVTFGLFEVFVRGLHAMPVNVESLSEIAINTGPAGNPLFTGLTVLLLLRAFSSGAVALTGVEAISNGVPAFKKPESHNAATTLMAMGFILGFAFMGLSVLAHNIQPTVSENETLLSTMANYLYRDGPSSIGSIGVVLYYVLQFSTFAILVLAANTAFADFPRVSSIIAADGYLPRQLSNRGDRLVFSNGILVLAVVAGSLIVGFGGITSALIPLYAVGVFTGFTLSQAGMVIHHRKEREKGWRRNQVINAVGSRRHVHRAAGGGRVEVHLRRLDPRRPDPGDRVLLPLDPQALHPGRGGARGAPRLPLPPAPPHRRRARRAGAPRRARRAHLRPLARPRPAHRARRSCTTSTSRRPSPRSGSATTSRSSSAPSTRRTASWPRR